MRRKPAVAILLLVPTLALSAAAAGAGKGPVPSPPAPCAAGQGKGCPRPPATFNASLMGDLDGNGRFDVVDLLVLLHTLGGNFTAGTPPCALPDGGDWDGSGSLGPGDAAVEALRLAGRERAALCEDPQPPVVTDLAVYPAPALPEPAPRAPFRDPVFGFCTVRVTDRAADLDAGDTAGGLKNEYSRVQSFNADESRILVRTTAGTWYLYDARTLRRVKRVELPGVDPRWDAADPDVLYSCEGTCLNRLNVRTGQVSLVHDFAADFAGQDVQTVWTRYEGSPSRDGRYWGLMAENGNWEAVALLVYDRQADAVTAVRSLPAGFDADNVSISPLGNYVVAYLEPDCPGGQTGTYASPCGFMVYNRALTQGSGPIPVAGHGDFALDAQGREVFVYQDTRTDHLAMLDLGTGAVTDLHPIDFSHTPLGFHVSGRAFDRPGWVVVSTSSGGYPTAFTWMDDVVFAMELAAGGRVVRLAHTRSRVDPAQEHDYWAEPQASVNRNFTRVLFTTNWGRSGTDQVEMFLLELPEDWPLRVAQ
ncbi:MAG: hypothetical protein KA419_13690 [Acidobacteria bacterium]|nr:hypothetical protein [Acidobacteriota bacterium]